MRNVPLLVHFIDVGGFFFDQFEVFHPEVSDDLCLFFLVAGSPSWLGYITQAGVLSLLTLPQEKQRIGMIILCWVSRWVCMGELMVCKRLFGARLWVGTGLLF
jgi:hypothetical protein